MQMLKPAAIELQPRPVSHWNNLFWWLLLIGTAVCVTKLPNFFHNNASISVPNEPKYVQTENEAFVSLEFGKISNTRSLNIPTVAFKSELQALKDNGYTVVRNELINRWKASKAVPLPAKPVLLTFDEANSETMEIADKVLADFGMSALVFVDVEQINQGNIQLVSWHRLEQLVMSRRWEIGILACGYGTSPNQSPEELQQRLITQRKTIEQRLHVPVVAAGCSQPSTTNSRQEWSNALKIAGIASGFLISPSAANYRDETSADYKRIRVSKDWDSGQFLAKLNTFAPRRSMFNDEFNAAQELSEWVIDTGEASITNGVFHLSNTPGESGAVATLGGTERWQDSEAEVVLKDQPIGQFWMLLRYGVGQPYVRLGVTDGQVIWQRFDGNSVTRLASQIAPSQDIKLKLRIVGSSSMAFVNGQPLLQRPIQVPEGTKHGAVALAIWKNKALNSETASVNVQAVNAKPLYEKSAIFAAKLGNTGWAQLQSQAEQLAILSPHYFSWIDSKAIDLGERDNTVAIFAHFHHLKFLPALYVAEKTSISEAPDLAGQILDWASDSDFNGINMVLTKSQQSEHWEAFLSDLSKRMQAIGKSLSVTVTDNKNQDIPAANANNNDLMLVSQSSQLFSADREPFYPMDAMRVTAQLQTIGKVLDD